MFSLIITFNLCAYFLVALYSDHSLHIYNFVIEIGLAILFRNAIFAPPMHPSPLIGEMESALLTQTMYDFFRFSLWSSL